MQNQSVDDILSMESLPQSFLKGLHECQWPGRAQVIPLEGHNIRLCLDGAHTGESMEVAKQWFFDPSTTDKDSFKVLVFNCNTNRDPTTLLKRLSDCPFDAVLFTTNET